MKVKSESEVTQLFLTLSDPTVCSLPGSSVHGIFQARGLEWGAIAFSVEHFRLVYFKSAFMFHFHTLEKEMATHSSVLAWRIPGMADSGGLPSLGSHRVRHD